MRSAVAIPCSSECSSCELPRAGRVEQRSHRFERSGCRERSLGGGRRLACVQGERGSGEARHRSRTRQRHHVSTGLRRRRGTFGLHPSVGREQSAGEQLEESRPPASADPRHLLSSGSREQRVDAPVKIPGLKQGGCERATRKGGKRSEFGVSCEL